MIGKPKYKRGDTVYFRFTDRDGNECEAHGQVCIVDAYGTFGQNEEPSYDIMVGDFMDTGEPCFCKHVVESLIYKKANTKEKSDEYRGLSPF